MQSKRGFTLTELLVVLAILAIAAAILLPAFAQARDKARQVTCINNMKQLSTAVMMYAQDYDERWPSVHWGIYLVTVQPYMRNRQVWACLTRSGVYTVRPCFFENFPSHNGQPGHPDCASAAKMIGYVVTGIAANSDVFGGWDNRPPRAMAVLDRPAETIMLVDNDVSVAATTAPPRGSIGAVQQAQMAISACQDARHVMWHTRWKAAPFSHAGRLGAKHAGGGNFAFADGHVKWLKTPPRSCAAWTPHVAIANRTIPRGNSVSSGACRPPGQGTGWCNGNIH